MEALWADFLQPAFWVAVGQIIWINGWLGEPFVDRTHLWAAAAGAAFVVLAGWWVRHRHHKRMLDAPLIIDPPGPEEFPHKSS